DRPARAHDARELAQRRERVVDVAQEIRERESVELRVAERELLGARLHEAHAVRPPARGREHLRALVDADDGAAVLPDELAPDQPRPRRDVEHRLSGPDVDARDEEAAPARILAEGQQRAVTVVRRPERW